jgi:hypothetical protein
METSSLRAPTREARCQRGSPLRWLTSLDVTLRSVATVTRNGKRRRLSYPPPPPADLPLAERERYALRVLADVAAMQLASLPAHSLVRRILEVPISELDHWGSDPRYAGQALGLGAARSGRAR